MWVGAGYVGGLVCVYIGMYDWYVMSALMCALCDGVYDDVILLWFSMLW